MHSVTLYFVNVCLSLFHLKVRIENFVEGRQTKDEFSSILVIKSINARNKRALIGIKHEYNLG